MFGDFDWGVDVAPKIVDFTDNGLVRGALVAVVVISIATYASRGLLSIFFKRD